MDREDNKELKVYIVEDPELDLPDLQLLMVHRHWESNERPIYFRNTKHLRVTLGMGFSRKFVSLLSRYGAKGYDYVGFAF